MRTTVDVDHEQLPDLTAVPIEDEQDIQALDRLWEELTMLRERLGLTHPDMAKKLGSRVGRVADWEQGVGRDQLRVSLAQRYARALGARVRFSLEYPEGHEPPAGQSTVEGTA